MAISKLNDTNIIKIIIEIMEIVEEFDDTKSSEDKKLYALQMLKTTLPDDVYERYQPLIEIIIDFIVEVSKGKVKIKINNKTLKKYCPCIYKLNEKR